MIEQIISQLSFLELIIAGCVVGFFLIQTFYYFFYYIRVSIRKRKDIKIGHDFGKKEPVSVIICARNEAENLRNFLPSVVNQCYPDYEIIIVNDGSYDETENVVKEFSGKYSNIYMTYVPEDTKTVSRKKLAITIGIKAAKNDILLFSDADCKPVSNNWIDLMTRRFKDNTEFVLGFGGYYEEKGFLNRLIRFDTLFIGMQYIAFALAGHPYMGVGRNLAYRKSTFYKNGNFLSHLDLQSGDDDLFVNQNATGKNTQVEVVSESVTLSIPKTTSRTWKNQKMRHLSTSPRYRVGTKIMLGVENLSRGLFYLSFLACFVTLNPIMMILGGSLFLLRWMYQIFIINASAKAFGVRRFFLSIPFFDIVLPLINLNFMMRNKLKKSRNQVWK
ncbi:MAG: glycosyltransferase [Paludibacteraceae bacterium]|nr:glycosyltransferase [Paludibacteraceae bacterium]